MGISAPKQRTQLLGIKRVSTCPTPTTGNEGPSRIDRERGNPVLLRIEWVEGREAGRGGLGLCRCVGLHPATGRSECFGAG